MITSKKCCDKEYIFADKKYQCSLNLAMGLIGGKWKILILWHLTDQTLRFSDLQKLLPEISKKVLTESLRELENINLISRKTYPQIPPKVEYSITTIGKSLYPSLVELAKWGELMSE